MSTLFHKLIQICAVLLATLLISGLEWYLYRRFKRGSLHHTNASLWRRSFLLAWHAPFQVFLGLTALYVAALFLYPLFSFPYPRTALHISHHVVVLLCFFWFVMRYIRYTENTIIEQIRIGVKKNSDRTSVGATAQLMRLLTIVIVLLISLQTFGVKLSAFLAVGGLFGAVVGFSAKDSLANFVGGLMLYWDRPFSVGDWIRSPDRQIEGIVQEIGWRLTYIRTFEHLPIYVPNGILANIVLENPGRMTHRRLKLLLSVKVRFKNVDTVQNLIEKLRQALSKHPDIDITQQMLVHLHSLNATFNVLIDAFTKKIQRAEFGGVQQRVLMYIFSVLTAFDTQNAFPLEIQDLQALDQ